MMKEIIPHVAFIVLNYNGFDDTVECIKSLGHMTYPDYEIVIVDNASVDGSGDRLKQIFPQHVYIQTGRNLGYAGGNNMGINYALEHGAEYVCVINNDVAAESLFLNVVITEMRKDKSIGIAGVKVCEYEKRDVIQSTGAEIHLLTGKVPKLNTGKQSADFTNIIDVDYADGACFVVRSALIDRVGLIPELYFLYFEETEWCLRAKRLGFRIVCVCAGEVYHKGASAVSKVSGTHAYYMMRNRIIFEKRNASWIQLLVFTGYIVLRYSLTLAKGLLTGKLDRNILRGFIDGMKYSRKL